MNLIPDTPQAKTEFLKVAAAAHNAAVAVHAPLPCMLSGRALKSRPPIAVVANEVEIQRVGAAAARENMNCLMKAISGTAISYLRFMRV